jgi:CDP-diacylglycerol--serine O-phosphatidyltransferase
MKPVVTHRFLKPVKSSFDRIFFIMIQELEPSKNPKWYRSIYLLPNLFTTTALFFGFYAIVAAINDRYEAAAMAIFIAMILDSLDGRVARLTNTQSAFGAEYDSLSDLICFGLAPALLMYQWSLSNFSSYSGLLYLGWLVAFIYTTATALRLARFNIQVGKTDKAYFQGLVSPVAAAILVGFIWLCNNYQLNGANLIILMWLLAIFISALMVSRVRYYSFKNIDFKGKIHFLVLISLFVLVLIFLDLPQILFFFFLLYAISGPIFTLIKLIKSPTVPLSTVDHQNVTFSHEQNDGIK